MNYVNIGIIIIAAFVISVILTKLEIPVLKVRAGQNIREEGPESHLSKAGTPSMGGIAIIISTAAAAFTASLIWDGSMADTLIILFVFIGFGLIGFFDDYLKVIKKNNLGLRAYQKFGLQIVISVALAVFLANYSTETTYVYIPVADIYVDFGIWYIPFIVFVVLAMTNAVNLTDGPGWSGFRSDCAGDAVFRGGGSLIRTGIRLVFLRCCVRRLSGIFGVQQESGKGVHGRYRLSGSGRRTGGGGDSDEDGAVPVDSRAHICDRGAFSSAAGGVFQDHKGKKDIQDGAYTSSFREVRLQRGTRGHRVLDIYRDLLSGGICNHLVIRSSC